MRGTKSTRLFSIALRLTLVLLFPSLRQAAAAAGKRDYAPSELLVKFKTGVPTYVMSEIHRGVGARVLKTFRADPRLHHVSIPKGWDLEKALAYYQSRADVQYAQPNLIYHITSTTTNDTYFSYQWAWLNTGQTNGTPGADTHATAAWDKGHGRFTVVVASIDTGVDYLHPDLGLNIWTNPQEAGLNCTDGIDNDANGYPDDCRGWNFVANNNDPRDDNGHGTHVAGTIGAQGNNALGVTGANWDVQIMPVKCFDAAGNGTTAQAISGIDYALQNGARILNNSWGILGTSGDPALLDAIKRAEAAGALFVAAAGNGIFSGTDDDVTPFFPCSYSSALFTGAVTPPTNILCVAETDANDNRAPTSNYGETTVHMGAPGVGILSTYLNQGYTFLDGTSMSTPHVTGAAALLKGCRASLDLPTIRQILLNTTRPVLALSGLTVTGGVVDYEAAINDRRAGKHSCDPAPSNVAPVANAGGLYGSNYRQPVQFNGSGSYDSDGQILLYFWDFGDGTTGVGAKPIHQYAIGGVYTVRLTVRDNLGGMSSQTTTATMRPTKH